MQKFFRKLIIATIVVCIFILIQRNTTRLDFTKTTNIATTGQVTTGIDLTNCVSYFDGCNNCSVKDGKPDACTLMYCETPSEPKCLQYATGEEDVYTDEKQTEINTPDTVGQKGNNDRHDLEFIDRLFSRDKDHVYINGQIVTGADPTTFESLGSWDSRTYRAKDKDHVYTMEGKIVEGINGASVERLEQGATLFVRDNTYVYNKDGKRVGIDPNTFNRFSWAMVKDKNYVYDTMGNRVDWMDAQTIHMIGGDYLSDRNGIYHEGGVGLDPKKLEGADPATFEYVYENGMNYDAQDKNHKYSRGNIVE